MIHKLTSVNIVLAKIIRDLGLNHSNEEIPINDFIEWIAEALLHVGTYAQMQQKVATIEIQDYKAKLPCDFYRIDDKNYSFSGWYWHEINGERSKSYFATARDFSIHLDTLTTYFREGSVSFPYIAFPVDENGFPLVPDNQSFRDLLFWKIVYQLAIRGHKFPSPQLQDINFSRQKLSFYTMQSRGEANMPDGSTMQQIANTWKSWGSSLQGVSYSSLNAWNSYKF